MSAVAVSVAARPCRGETVSGDATLVRQAALSTFFAVIDALGHGPHAAATAAVAVTALEKVALDLPLVEITHVLDRALKGTRGAAALIGWVREAEVECCAVGNVDLRSVGARLPVMLTPGILGYGVPRLHCFSGRLAPGNRLIVFTDGISGRFAADEIALLTLEQAGQSILERYGRRTDDATVMILEAR